MVAGISVANARLEKSELYIYNFIYNKHSAILIYNVFPITFMGNLTPENEVPHNSIDESFFFIFYRWPPCKDSPTACHHIVLNKNITKNKNNIITIII